MFDGGCRPTIPRAWKGSRPWLQPRVRPAPQKCRRKRLGVLEFWHHIRTCLRAWWIWLGIAMLLLQTGIWLGALLAGSLAFLFYYTSPHSHSAVYPLEPDLLTASDEFSGHSGRHDGHATGFTLTMWRFAITGSGVARHGTRRCTAMDAKCTF
jgi:hypothetical protein